MPRNVVTVLRRGSLLRWRRERRARQDAAFAELGERYRLRVRDDGKGVEIDFAKQIGRDAARARVVDDLETIEPEWRRLFVVYPRR